MKHMEILRRKLVYELFINQFIEMSRVSVKYRSLQQTMSLLKQAERICKLLSDDKFNAEADEHQRIIEEIRQSIQTIVSESVQGPELPRRESVADKIPMGIRYRPGQPLVHSTSIDGPSRVDEVPSDDDNDEIYNYHRSVIAQIHATSAENLARFQHADENDDDIDEITKSIGQLEANLDEENSDYESDNETQL